MKTKHARFDTLVARYYPAVYSFASPLTDNPRKAVLLRTTHSVALESRTGRVVAMGTKVAILLICLASLCRADIVDLTPGGFEGDPLPPSFFKLFELDFFDEAAHGVFNLPGSRKQYLNQWVSQYGDLDGGKYFFTNIFILPRHTPSAQVWWSFPGMPIRPPNFSLGMLDIFGRKSDGTPWEHLYLVRGPNRFFGQTTVTLDGDTGIESISFYGYED